MGEIPGESAGKAGQGMTDTIPFRDGGSGRWRASMADDNAAGRAEPRAPRL